MWDSADFRLVVEVSMKRCEVYRFIVVTFRVSCTLSLLTLSLFVSRQEYKRSKRQLQDQLGCQAESVPPVQQAKQGELQAPRQ